MINIFYFNNQMSSRNQLVFVSNPEFPMKTNYRRKYLLD